MGQFSLLVLFLLAVAFVLRIDFIFYVIYVCLGIYAWSRWYTPKALKKIQIRRVFSNHAFWGEVVPIHIELKNRHWLPLPWFQFSESIAVQLAIGQRVNQVVSLRSRETTTVSYQVRAARRGYYELGPLRIAMGDLFGLADEQQRIFPADHLTVYPRITPLSDLGLPSRLPFGTVASRQRLFEDPARPVGVRDYRSGDAMRQINWKASAHTRGLLVKTFEPSISLETTLLLNLHRGDYRRQERQPTIEWAIEVAASLAVHLVNQRQSVGLIANGVDPLQTEGATFDDASGRLLLPEGTNPAAPPNIPPRPGRGHLMKVLERLARIETVDAAPFHQWAVKACLHLGWGVTILAVTAAGNEAVCQALHRLVRAGYNPVLIVVEPDYNFSLVRERARGLGFAAYNVSARHDLDQWRRPSHVNRP